uniref:Metalloendopeptidase n=1 Tax=Heterorhabditis bacteriophora TaxID=37862 RepID=A0A1I7XT65_HETBA
MSLLRCIILTALPCLVLSYSLKDSGPLNEVSYRTRRRADSRLIDDKKTRMGLTKEEQKVVQYYMNKLKELGQERYPDQDKSLDSTMKKWNQRMKDDIEGEIMNPEEHGRHFEGDIILFPDQAKEIYENALKDGARRVKRKFIGSSLRRWDPNRPIVYGFDGSHTSREQRIIELALEHWHNITCLNFVRNDNAKSGNRIVFTDVDGCASNVGRHPLGEEQLVSLAPECIRVGDESLSNLGVIAHEVAHALGFWHEQSRPDRDQFVNVRWENIDKDSKGQFLKEDPDDVDNAGVPYDYGSIMHYRSKAFSRYDDLYTISTFVTDYQKTIGQRDQLSFNDIRLMNKIYCSNVCPRKLPCQRGGYTDPRRCDRCRCPDGFTGQFCEQVMPGYGAVCGGKLQVSSGWTKISSPGYPREFKEGRLRFHVIKLGVLLILMLSMQCYRYCCYGTPNTMIRSATEDLVVLFRSFYRGGRGFEARARALPLTGSWASWTPWTPCTASCGACGSRMRTRVCSPGGACASVYNISTFTSFLSSITMWRADGNTGMQHTIVQWTLCTKEDGGWRMQWISFPSTRCPLQAVSIFDY